MKRLRTCLAPVCTISEISGVPGSDDTVLCRKKCRSNDIQCILNDTQTITYQGLALPTVQWLPSPFILTTMRAVIPKRSTHFTDYEILEGNINGTFDILKGEGVGSLRLVKPVIGPLVRSLKVLMSIQFRYKNRPQILSFSRHLAIIKVIVSPYNF